MFIKKITIKNFRLFSYEDEFEIDNINIPDNQSEGSGLNVFVGENGCGKTTLLDAFSLPLLEYKSNNFSINDFNEIEEKVDIKIFSQQEFKVNKTMPNGSFIAKGFNFEAGLRERESKAYLSSMIVNDQKFIPSDSSTINSTSPDLRVNVNNPFKGKRFSDNDVLFLDKNRLFQIRAGNFNSTRFDRLMENFNYQYIKNLENEIKDLNSNLDMEIKKDKVENKFLAQAIDKFNEICNFKINLDFLNNHEPFKQAFFCFRQENNQQILLNALGSGYEMIFSLLYSFYLARQSRKDLIILIDEPELHLHPQLQRKFVEFLLEFSKEAQIILASHSPLLVKQLSENDKTKIRVLKNNKQKISEIEKRALPYVSANEINFLAFNLATIEYHIELYEELKFLYGDGKTIKKFDNDFFIGTKGEPKNSPWRSHSNEVSQHTFIRNQIHHLKENGNPMYNELKESIEKMRSFLIK